METNASVLAPIVETTAASPTTTPPIATLPPSVVVSTTATIYSPPVPMLLAYAKPFPDISRIEVFSDQNFKRWQERIFSILDMHGVAWLLSIENTLANIEAWTHTSKVSRHTILTTLSNELFDVYYAYKEAKVI